MGDKKKQKNAVYTFRVFRYKKIHPIVTRDEPTGCRIPYARYGHRIVSDTNNLYSFGGHNSDICRIDRAGIWVPLFQKLWKFNFAQRKWICIFLEGKEAMPREEFLSAVVTHGNILMVHGGKLKSSASRSSYSNRLYLWSLGDEKKKMREIATTGQAPLPAFGHRMVYHDGYLYTIGGRTEDHRYSCDIHRLNMKTYVWEAVYVGQSQKQKQPLGRYLHEVAFNGTDIIILGGSTSTTDNGPEPQQILTTLRFDILPAFNLKSQRWTMMKTFPDPKSSDGIPKDRRSHGCVQIGSKDNLQVFISGGCNRQQPFNDLWKLDLKTLRWTFIDTCQLPYPIHFHAVTVTPQGKMYIYGGKHYEEENEHIFSTWLHIPKLSEMCWEAVLFYNPKIGKMRKHTLRKEGVPMHFINRLES